ncbi:MAG: YcjF family protein [Limisphaerales bacterium]
MTTEGVTMNEQEETAVVSICILAAFADGTQSEVERAQIKRIVDRFSDQRLDVSAVYQEVLAGKVSLDEVVIRLQSASAKALAYEMAVCVCHADDVLTEAENEFLAKLHEGLHLDAGSTAAVQQTAGALAIEPLRQPPRIAPGTGGEAELDRMILNSAILNGALEIMPHSLATMAIIPLQMRMVYRIGKSYGYELERGHIKDFLATVGIGLTSQVVEGFIGKLVGGLARSVAGGLLGGLVGQAAGSGVAFAVTYALGQVAKRYYASDRTLEASQLKEVFASMISEGRSMQGRFAGDIAQKSRQVNVAELLPLVREH